MAAQEELALAAAKLRLGLGGPEAVVDAAATALATASLDDGLVELAIAEPRAFEVMALVDQAWAAQNWPELTDERAGRLVALDLCRAIGAGEVTPVRGAYSIDVVLSRTVPTLREEWSEFALLADAWGGTQAGQPAIEAKIRAAAANRLRLAEGAP